MTAEAIQNFKMSDEEFIAFYRLTEEETRQLFNQCDENSLCVESIDCFISKDEIYCQTHTYDFFCEDYLFPPEGWHWKALEQHLLSYKDEAEVKNPEDFLVFTVGIIKSDQGRANGLNVLVERLKNDPDHRPKDFNKPKNIKMIMID